MFVTLIEPKKNDLCSICHEKAQVAYRFSVAPDEDSFGIKSDQRVTVWFCLEHLQEVFKATLRRISTETARRILEDIGATTEDIRALR